MSARVISLAVFRPYRVETLDQARGWTTARTFENLGEAARVKAGIIALGGAARLALNGD